MAKVRVQDATKELSTNAAKLMESISRMRKQSQDVLGSLRRVQDGYVREERERHEQAAKEELRKQYEAAAQFMSAYSSEPAEATPPAAEAPVVVPAEKAEAPVAAPEPAPVPAAKAEPAFAEPEIKSEPETRSEPARAEAARPAAQQPQRRPAPVQQGTPGVGAPGQPRYGRPVNPQPGMQTQPGMQGQPRYGRPVNPQPGMQAQPGMQGQPRYGRPVNPGQPGMQAQPGMQGQPRYGRPVNPAQAGAPGAAPGQRYGRPVNPGQPGMRPAPGAQGAPGGRPQPGAGRFGGGAGRPGFGRPKAPELTPTTEKEKVSNYDPNKKQYERPKNPERTVNANQRRRDARPAGGMDDEFFRGRKKKKSSLKRTNIEPIKIETAYMTAETITVKDLSERIGKTVGEIIKKLMMLGIIATINNELDFDTAALVCSEYGIEFEKKIAETAEDALANEDTDDDEEDLEPRPPVVTIMGHVDHGKTTLLDYIRKTRVTATEAGGITQHIGAYTVELDGQEITFLDTPGHEAFTAMRMRGAQATDIAILVIAADDGVMPQTIEAINHAKAAGVEIIVAINRMDKVGANPDRVRQQLTEYELVDEQWGGDTMMVPVSALTGEGVDQLLESILLVAEVQDYRANPNRKARGIIIEARLDKGRGPVATVLVKNGTLNVGDTIIAGTAYGRVRAMTNDKGENVKSAGPSMPVEVIGFGDVPEAGDIISAVDDDRLSRQVAEERKDKLRAALIKNTSKTTLDDLFNQISAGEVKDLNLIIKADVQGSVEAVRQSLEKLSNEEVRVRSIHGGVGAITETDVMLASASGAIIIGFNVRPDNNARDIAERENVDIRLYRVIYNAIEDVQQAMNGMLSPKFKENVLGRAEVRQVYKITGVGIIAGSYVLDGKIARNAQVRLLRDNVVIHEGKIDSLKRFKDDAKEVATGYECGIGLERYSDIREGDIIECFLMEEIVR